MITTIDIRFVPIKRFFLDYSNYTQNSKFFFFLIIYQYKPHYYCEYDGCEVLASCNYPSEGKKRFCGKHKLDGMVILNKPKCAFPGHCNVRPSFNYLGESSKGQYCFKHRLLGMQVGRSPVKLNSLLIILLITIFKILYALNFIYTF